MLDSLSLHWLSVPLACKSCHVCGEIVVATSKIIHEGLSAFSQLEGLYLPGILKNACWHCGTFSVAFMISRTMPSERSQGSPFCVYFQYLLIHSTSHSNTLQNIATYDHCALYGLYNLSIRLSFHPDSSVVVWRKMYCSRALALDSTIFHLLPQFFVF